MKNQLKNEVCLWSEAVSQWRQLFWLIPYKHPTYLWNLGYWQNQNISVLSDEKSLAESPSDFLVQIYLSRNSVKSLNLLYVSLTRDSSLNPLHTDLAVVIRLSLPKTTSLLIITGFLPEKSAHRKRKSEQPSPKKIKWINCTSKLKGY